MNVQETIAYLEELLPGFTVTCNEFWENKPNNRFVFERDGVDAAMLFAQKLKITKEFLQDVATAVQKRFNSPKAIEKSVEKLAQSIPDKKSEAPVNEVAGKPSELELNFYRAAKQVVADFEAKYPMT